MLAAGAVPGPFHAHPALPGTGLPGDGLRDAPPIRTPARLLEVVDGDTLRVRCRGREEVVRLACVDTEEKLSGRPPSSPTKPGTLFGQETSYWLDTLLARATPREGALELELVRPAEAPERDAFGRLLAHVRLPDGRDLARLLVEEGRSPYFTKYGRCRLADAELEAAQRAARRARRGLWNPRTNEPRHPGAPAARRPYETLLPWWEARARAVDAYRAARRRDPDGVLAADRPDEVAERLASHARDPGARVRVFGSLAALFEERDGSLTLLFHGGPGPPLLRARLPARTRPALLRGVDLGATLAELEQNYVWVEGHLTRGPRGPLLVDPSDVRLAGPRP